MTFTNFQIWSQANKLEGRTAAELICLESFACDHYSEGWFFVMMSQVRENDRRELKRERAVVSAEGTCASQ